MSDMCWVCVELQEIAAPNLEVAALAEAWQVAAGRATDSRHVYLLYNIHDGLSNGIHDVYPNASC